MLSWDEFARHAPEFAAAGARLLQRNEVAFLATVSRGGKPRLHPFVPKIVDGRLLTFIMASSPKQRDLRERGHYAMHCLPGDEDEEFNLTGQALPHDEEAELRSDAARAMGFVTGVDDSHLLYELMIDHALWTTWLDFGTPRHRPNYRRWSASQG